MSTAIKPERRKLTFATLDDVVADAERLRDGGYDKVGNWDLAQVCFHISEWMRFPLDGFPKPPLPIAMMLWVMRKTIGPKMYRQYLAEGMPSGKPTIPQSIAPPGGEVNVAIAKLKETVARFQEHAGPLHPSPLFGALDKEAAMKLQLVHCAHHLSFLVPRAA